MVALGERAVLLDPGPETHTARTFSARRNDSKLLNSWGHPVREDAPIMPLRVGIDLRRPLLAQNSRR